MLMFIANHQNTVILAILQYNNIKPTIQTLKFLSVWHGLRMRSHQRRHRTWSVGLCSGTLVYQRVAG